jgi:hypothetical protein
MEANEKKQLEEMAQSGKKTIVLMSYNPIDGFIPGVHGDGRIVVYCWDRRLCSEACRDAARSITDAFYRDFNLRKDGQLFEHIFVYAGKNAIDEAIQAARMIGHDWKDGSDSGKRVTLVACDCEIEMKRRIAHESYTINMILCECGGKATMGRIAQQVIEGRNPKEISDYAR